MAHHREEIEISEDADPLPHLQHSETLGSVRLQQAHTGAVLLVPQPTDDPNDPLGWCVSPVVSRNASPNHEIANFGGSL